MKCARGEDCLGAKDVVVEFECGSTPTPSLSHGSSSSSSSSGRAGSDGGDGEGSESPWTEKDEAGYWRQEIEGLGGIVKKKFRKREKVGGTVKEWEDEREGSEEVLGREKEGRERSWCGWCGRVVLGEAELEEITGETLKNKT